MDSRLTSALYKQQHLLLTADPPTKTNMCNPYKGLDGRSIFIHFLATQSYTTNLDTNTKMKVSRNNKQIKTNVTLKGVEKKLHKVCDQMTILHMKIQNLQTRYQRTRHTPDSPLNQSLSMQLNVHQFMYNAYYQYAAKQTQQLMVLYSPGPQEVQAE